MSIEYATTRPIADEKDNVYLHKCGERGVYNPASVLKPGETPPTSHRLG